MQGYELEVAKNKQSSLLVEARHESLVKEAKSGNLGKSFRQKVGSGLVKLGQSLSKEALPEQA